MKESTLLAISAPIAVEILRAIKVDNIVRRSAVRMTKTMSVPLVEFQHKYRLDRHMKTHTGERNFGCPIPGYTSAYYTKSNVGIHIKLTHKLDHKEVFAEYGGPIKL